MKKYMKNSNTKLIETLLPTFNVTSRMRETKPSPKLNIMGLEIPCVL